MKDLIKPSSACLRFSKSVKPSTKWEEEVKLTTRTLKQSVMLKMETFWKEDTSWSKITVAALACHAALYSENQLLAVDLKNYQSDAPAAVTHAYGKKQVIKVQSDKHTRLRASQAREYLFFCSFSRFSETLYKKKIIITRCFQGLCFDMCIPEKRYEDLWTAGNNWAPTADCRTPTLTHTHTHARSYKHTLGNGGATVWDYCRLHHVPDRDRGRINPRQTVELIKNAALLLLPLITQQGAQGWREYDKLTDRGCD